MNVEVIRNLVGRVSVFRDYDDFFNFFYKNEKNVFVLSFLNAHAINLALKNEKFRAALEASNCLLRDGVGFEMLSSILKIDPGINMNGTDLIPVILKKAALENKKIGLIGTTDFYVEKAASILINRGANISFYINGFKNIDEYVDVIKSSDVQLIILGMGMPKQEIVASEIASRLDKKLILINGGAIIDFIAGRFTRAPLWLRKLKMEWAYRFFLEPRRLWKRYFLGNIVFMLNLRKLKKYENNK